MDSNCIIEVKQVFQYYIHFLQTHVDMVIVLQTHLSLRNIQKYLLYLSYSSNL